MEFRTQERAAYENALNLIDLALAEDLLGAMDDPTSRLTIPESASGSARFVARSAGVLAGEPVLRMLAERFGLKVGPGATLRDGDRLEPGSVIARVEGPMAAARAPGAPWRTRRGGTSRAFSRASTASTPGAGSGKAAKRPRPHGATGRCARRSVQQARSGSSRTPSS